MENNYNHFEKGEKNNIQIKLRKASESDYNLVFQWINDPFVRKMSFNNHQISQEEHQEWFFSALKNPKCVYFIALLDAVPIGQVRFSVRGNEAEVSILIDPGYRGKGYGTILIENGLIELMKEKIVKKIHAYVLVDNMASYSSFISAGFKLVGMEEKKNKMAYHLIFVKPHSLSKF